MSRVLFVTGTNTEVGKTAVTAAVAALAVRAGLRTAVLKPGQTGVAPGEPGDAEEVVRLLGPAGARLTTRELVRYPEPLSPERAGLRSGLPFLTVPQFVGAVEELTDSHDLVLVEGAGGLLVRYDADGLTLADLAQSVAGAELLLVAHPGLGTLSITALSAEALRARKLACAGVVIGSWPSEPDLATRCNLADLPVAARAPLLGALPLGAPGAADFAALAATSLAPELGGRWDAAAFTEAHAVPFA
ncbi:dethiobiotin synthase [Kitasatospora sp. NBC_01287]|uniref:dethiobiotin synthase n=1 Tax=Kitasatospora sp. NBC_01287 TaxID=2903573 RepID=UPI002254CF0F|nr:dethiobiotin synthase [Kitasatospora sp. NBC_01287]MCX4744697.1 dethiobiotin synthase [Kitasatospora sp. NBC_01287]